MVTAPRRWRRRLLIVLAAWAAAAVLPLVAATGPLLSARGVAERGVGHLEAGRWDEGLTALDRARSRFRLGAVLLRNPVARVGWLLPILGGNARLAGDLARAGELAAGGAQGSLTAALDVPGGLSGFLPREGRIPVEPLVATAPALRDSADAFAEAEALVRRPPSPFALPPLRRARVAALAHLAEAAPGAEGAAQLAAALPDFLGAAGRRRYFLGAANPAELRGSGGFLGSYSILELDGGRVRISAFRPIQTLRSFPAAEVPAPSEEFAERWAQQGGAGFWMNITMSPDFPSVASAVLGLYERGRGQALDGVILVDPHALAALLELTGPQTVEGTDVVVDSGSVVEYVSNRAYADLADDDERKDVLGDVAARALATLMAGGTGRAGGAGSPEEALRSLGRAAARGHVLLASVREAEQRAFEAAGVAGRLNPSGPDEPGQVLSLVVNNAASNKVDYYLQQSLEVDVHLQPGGRAHLQGRATVSSSAPTDGYPSHVIGPNVDGLVAGEHLGILTLYCGGCRAQGVTRDGQPANDVRQSAERGLLALDARLQVRSGETRTFEYDLAALAVWEPLLGGSMGRYRLVVRPQTTIRPPLLRLRVRPPEGMRIAAAWGAGARTHDGLLVFEGVLEDALEVEVELAAGAGAQILGSLREILGREVVRIPVSG